MYYICALCNSHPREATTGSKSCEKGFWSNSKPGDELKVPHAVGLWYLSYLDASWLYFISLMVFHIMRKMVTFQYLLLRMTFGYSWCRVNGLADRPNSQLIQTFPFSFPLFSYCEYYSQNNVAFLFGTQTSIKHSFAKFLHFKMKFWDPKSNSHIKSAGQKDNKLLILFRLLVENCVWVKK